MIFKKMTHVLKKVYLMAEYKLDGEFSEFMKC